MDPIAVGLGLFGVACAVVVGGVTYRDATRVGVSRPRLWACATSGTISVGLVLFLFTTAPIPGALMTAIVGPVLYGFERETATEERGPVAPGSLPNGSPDDGSARHSTDDESTDGAARTADGPGRRR